MRMVFHSAVIPTSSPGNCEPRDHWSGDGVEAIETRLRGPTIEEWFWFLSIGMEDRKRHHKNRSMAGLRRESHQGSQRWQRLE